MWDAVNKWQCRFLACIHSPSGFNNRISSDAGMIFQRYKQGVVCMGRKDVLNKLTKLEKKTLGLKNKLEAYQFFVPTSAASLIKEYYLFP